jgi:glycosyltransferase involved in cell wall biosynthesis
MSARRPVVSVVMATRDRPLLLRDALATVAAQTLAPAEVRIGDDGGVPAVHAAESLPALEVTVVTTEAGGPGRARNAAAAGARGELLAFLDDDDLWRPGHLAALVAAFDDPATVFAFSDWEAVRERVGDDGTRVAEERLTVALDWDAARMRRDDHVPPSTWMMRRALFESLGGFDPAFPFSEDWDLLLRAAALATPRRVPGVTAEVRLRDSGNASADHGAGRRACLERLAARHGMAVPAPKTFWEVAAEAAAESR